MESGALEMKWLSRLANAFLSSAEGAEVFRGFRSVRIEVHDDSATVALADTDVEVYFCVSHLDIDIVIDYNFI